MLLVCGWQEKTHFIGGFEVVLALEYDGGGYEVELGWCVEELLFGVAGYWSRVEVEKVEELDEKGGSSLVSPYGVE